jgi:hypothetical protein
VAKGYGDADGGTGVTTGIDVTMDVGGTMVGGTGVGSTAVGVAGTQFGLSGGMTEY